MKNKKGSHVGMMLSFVIFVTFLVFLYVILEPSLRIRLSKDSAIDSLKLGIAEELGSSTGYTRTSITTTDSDFASLVSELANRYENDYSGLKSDLGVSESDEFGFVFTEDSEEDIIAEKDIPSTTSVYAKKIPVYYIGAGENSFIGFITLKVW